MKVSIVRGGGIAGLVTTTSADTEALASEHAQRLRDMVARCGLRDLPGNPPAGPAGPDRFSYRLTLEDEGGTHTVGLREEDLTEDLDALIAWVGSVPGHTERVGPPGR